MEKIDEEGRERMSRANSGFLFDFVDRYEIDRRRVLASLPSESYNGQKEYDFEDVEFTTWPAESAAKAGDVALISVVCDRLLICVVDLVPHVHVRGVTGVVASTFSSAGHLDFLVVEATKFVFRIFD